MWVQLQEASEGKRNSGVIGVDPGRLKTSQAIYYILWELVHVSDHRLSYYVTVPLLLLSAAGLRLRDCALSVMGLLVAVLCKKWLRLPLAMLSDI